MLLVVLKMVSWICFFYPNVDIYMELRVDL